jgi:hypothetical protein
MTKPRAKNIIASSANPSIKLTPENKCSFCKGSKCCQYVTESIITPRAISDFDHLLWQISHPNIHIYKDEEGWTLVFLSQCQHLLANGRCGIYEKRPMICREHSNDYCEYDTDIEGDSELYFHNYAELDNYCRKRFKTWDRRFDKLSA